MTTFTVTAKIQTILAISVLTLGTLASGARAAAPAAGTSLPGQPLDAVIAVANDQPVLESGLDQRMARVGAALQAQGTPLPPESTFRHQILERLITQKLLLQAAQQKGIQVGADQVNATLSRVASQHGLTLAQLPKALAAQGQNYLVFRRQIKDQLTVHQLIEQAVASQVEVTSAEVGDYMKREANAPTAGIEYQLAQILLAFPAQETPQSVKATQQKAKTLERQLKAGANFAQLAVANSDGPHALKGGTIGWIKSADLPTLLQDAVPKMQPGDVSAPIAGPGGYHIVKLVATRSAEGNAGTQYHLRHILLKPNPVRDLAQSKALAEKLRGEIIAGKTSFATAAKANSNDPNSAGAGGDLGWKTVDELPPAFKSVLPDLPLDKISEPVQSHYGWHLIEVLGKRKGNLSEEQRKHEAYQAIYQRKLNDQLAEFKRVIRGQAYVKILNPADAGSAGTSAGALPIAPLSPSGG
jgi:peptidyl-prolyl cis-trans isomerase SurA